MKLQHSPSYIVFKQGDMPLSEFIREARRLAELCNYPIDKDRLIRDIIVSGIRSLRTYQKCLDTKDLSLRDCITICQTEDAIRMQVQDCRPEYIGKAQNAQTMIPESITAVQSAQTMTLVNRLQQGPRQSHNSNKGRYKSRSCYYCGAPNWTRELLRVCEANNYICGNCNKRGHLDSMCRSRPMYMLEAQSTVQSETTQDYAHSLEIAQQQNSSRETTQYSTPYFLSRNELPQANCNNLQTIPYTTPYFMSRKELPQVNCNSLQTIQVSRLGANEKSEQIQPAWIAESQNSEMHQMNVEIDTGAGCNVMPLYKVKELFGQEWLVQRLSPPTVRIKAYGDHEVKVFGSIVLYMHTKEKTDRVTWQVTDTMGVPILGRSRAKHMNYINYPEIHAPQKQPPVSQSSLKSTG